MEKKGRIISNLVFYGLVLVTSFLKIFGVIDWSWFLITSPIWFPLFFFTVTFFVTFLFRLITPARTKEKKKNKLRGNK
jgi:hypothetical protein